MVENLKVAMDLRSGGGNDSVVVDYTNKTSAVTGKGAVLYINISAIGVKEYLEFSDRNDWVVIFSNGKPPIVVMANKTTQNTKVFEGADYGFQKGHDPEQIIIFSELDLKFGF